MIRLEGIAKLYSGGDRVVEALRDVSLHVKMGEMVSVVGRSGSGKSTLMYILGCLDVPDAGSYRLMGQDVGKMTGRERARVRNEQIGFIFQGFHLSPQRTALENVELPLIFRGVAPKARRQMALEALEQVGLSDRLGHKPSELSGGQQQRVAIARALASKPPLILADEPTGNLDAASGAAVLSILDALHEKGHTILLITHDMSVAERSERILTMADGILR